MKIKNKIHGIASVLSLVVACSFAQGQTIVVDWEKAGDAEGWAPPKEYLKEYPVVQTVSQSGDVVNNGKGSLKLSVDVSADVADASARRGRVDKYYGGKQDWKRFESFSIMCYVPEGAPEMMGSIAVMSGAWKWSQSEPIVCKPGAWTKVSIKTADITSPEEIQLVMFIPIVPSGAFKGDIFIDKAMLEGEKVIGPSKPGPEPTSPSSTWLETFDSVEGWERQGARVEVAPEAAFGSGAATFFLPGFITKKIKSPEPLDPNALDEGYAGISFWVKGDGSDQFGTIVLCGMHPQWFPFKYSCSFPLKDTEWKQYKFRWDEMVPEDQTYYVGTPGGAPPSNFGYIKVGNKWNTTFNNANTPKYSFQLDQLQVEAELHPAKPLPERPRIDVVLKKLAAKEPVSILCLGDSITAGTSLRDANNERYAQVLEGLLRERCGYEEITVVSRAVGGAQGNDLRLWTERDFTGINPDLAIVMFGYNDKSWGYSAVYYGDIIVDYLDRIARQTEGKTAVLLMPAIPGRGPRYIMMDDYAEATRRVAKEKGVDLCDMNKVFKDFGRAGLNEYMADDAHPNAKGHAKMAETIADLLTTTESK